MGSELTIVLRYVRNLGLYTGLVIFFKVEIFKRKRFKIPLYPHPIHLRPFSTDVKVFREIFLFRTYLYDISPSPCVIVDAGANTGLSSVFFACRFPAATVYAIEPERSNFDCLLRNIKHYGNITAVQTALWCRDTVLKIHDQDEDQWAFTVEECNNDDPHAFTAMSLTSLMQRYQISHIDLLKLDIEGAEKEVFLENCDYWLMRTKVIMIELHDWIKPGCSSAFFKTISRYKIKTQLLWGMLVIELLP
jgi:FkbM family methyltransferase